ncbi:hypothetical protein TNCV_406461 [Trichonephila clavipes]|nr:hypothetical protein TNCV_406461 [Trichonephila clavipes]
MSDIKIDDNCPFEEERRLNVYLNSNKLEQLENQHTEKLEKDEIRAFIKSLRVMINSRKMLKSGPDEIGEEEYKRSFHSSAAQQPKVVLRHLKKTFPEQPSFC